MQRSPQDHVEHVRAQWARERPDLDTSPIAVVARVGRLARLLDAGVDRVLGRHGLRRESWDVLASLRRSGAPYRLSPTQLYRSLMRTSGAMSNRLQRIEAQGLIRRVRDPADRRGMLVELTAEGLRLVDRVAPIHLANERELLSPLTAAEQRSLARLLAKLLAAHESKSGAR